FGNDKGQAVVLPLTVPPRHADNVLVPEVLQRLGGESGTRAARAIGDYWRVLVYDFLLNPLLEEPARNVNRARQMAFVPLVFFADIQKNHFLPALALRVDLADIRFTNIFFCLTQ